MLLLLICLTTFGSVAFAMGYALQPRSNDVRRRMMASSGAPYGATSDRSFGSRVIGPFFGQIGSSLAKILPTNMIAGIDKVLTRGGRPGTLLPFLTTWAVVATAAVGIGLFIIAQTSGPILTIYALMAIVFGCAVPYLLIRRRASKRVRAIERALPDTIDLLLTSVEAGLSVDAAFALVAERSHGPIADVFTDYLRQVGLGRSRRDALADVADQCGARGMERLATTVAQTWEIGASMGDVLRVQASELRAERRSRAEETAQKAPFYMTIPLALCFMPAMGAVIITPAILKLTDYISGGFN